MFDDIGNKIKTVAVVEAYLVIVLSVIGAIAALMEGELFFAIILVVVGVITGFLSTCLIYGFGQLIENSQIIADSVKRNGSGLLKNDKEPVGYIEKSVMKNEGTPPPRKESSIKDGWKCSACGKLNPSYTGTCSCGKSKYN